jgi:hypothetical protein
MNSRAHSFPKIPPEETPVKPLMFAIAIAFAASAYYPSDASAAKRDSAYSQKKADCNRRANKMGFGVHWIKKNRWVKDCIAGGHPA